MHIVLLAPHPFYQERGTPIAVNLLLRALSEAGHRVDVVTFHEGEDVDYPNVTLHRIAKPPGVSGVGPGFSIKKLICDAWLFFKAWGVIRRAKPDVVHAVEESVFMARLFGRPYVYDMDSSLSAQLTDKKRWLRPALPLLRAIERGAVKGAQHVVPVCQALAEIATEQGARNVTLLPDISLLDEYPATDEPTDLPPKKGTRFLYIGNLEAYQGIDLLLEAFTHAQLQNPDLELIIVGGTPAHIEHYKRRCADVPVHFAGPRPVEMIQRLATEADILVSPRIQGTNTPMKIYSYLDTGRPVLATNLPTHTQVLTNDIACLADPEVEAFAVAMLNLAEDPALRERLGDAGHTFARANHSYPSFARTVREIYPRDS